MAPTQHEPPLARRAKGLDEDIRQGDVVGSGRWEILDAGTQGGMATVFRARDTRTGGEVALKVIAKRYIGRFDREKRFENEGRLAARLKGHRNIAAPIETGVLADRANRMYLAMELVRGPTLLDFISMNGALPVEQACVLIRDIARALRDLHASEVVHRDLTSSNIIIVETGVQRHCAKVIDFGLAADVGAEGSRSQRLTRVGELPGTPHYMAPEQVWGHAAHPTFDVYALGVVLFEMLTGEPPWHTMSDVEVKARKCDLAQPPPSLSAARRDVPAALDTLVTACLMPRYEDRLPSSGAFVVRLDEICERLGVVNPHAGESTGVVGTPRTIDGAPREPKLKEIVAEAMAAKQARARGEVQDAVTAPVAAADADRVRAVITGQTRPATAAERPREPTRRATAAESGQAAPRISGRTVPVTAADDTTDHAPPRTRLALFGVAAGLLVAVPILYWWFTREDLGPAPGTAVLAASAATQIESSATARADAPHDGSATQAPARPVAALAGSTSEADADAAETDDGAEPNDDADDASASAPPAADDAAPPAPDDDAGSRSPTDDGPSAPAGDGPALPRPPHDTKQQDPAAADTTWTEARCARERELAMADRLAGRFAGVLRHTRIKRCWPNAKQRLELRVRAFSEKGNNRECIREGEHASDPGVQRMVRRCRKKLGDNP